MKNLGDYAATAQAIGAKISEQNNPNQNKEAAKNTWSADLNVSQNSMDRGRVAEEKESPKQEQQAEQGQEDEQKEKSSGIGSLIMNALFGDKDGKVVEHDGRQFVPEVMSGPGAKKGQNQEAQSGDLDKATKAALGQGVEALQGKEITDHDNAKVSAGQGLGNAKQNNEIEGR